MGNFFRIWVTWQRGQRTREPLESQVLFIANAVAPALDHADPVVQTFDESERDLVVRLTGLRDALPGARRYTYPCARWRRSISAANFSNGSRRCQRRAFRTARLPTTRGLARLRRPALRPPPRLGGRPDGVSHGRPVSAGPIGRRASAWVAVAARDRGAPSIRPLHTRSVTLRWCDRSFRRNIREAPAIHGMPRDPVALKRVLLRNAPGKFVGDIDILFFNKSEPERAVAIEVKRIKVGPKAFLTNKPNEQCRRGDVSRYDKSVTSNCGQRDIGTRIGTTGGICRLELHITDGPSAAHDR